MANKHLTEDNVSLIVNVETSKAQQEIKKLENSLMGLRSKNKQQLNSLVKMEAAGQKNTQAYKNMQAEYRKTSKDIRETTSKITEHTSKLNVLDMTMNQLRKQQKMLQRELDDTAQSLNPEAYSKLEQKLAEVSGRMAELKQNAKSFKEIASSDAVNGMMFGSMAAKATDYIGAQLDKLKEFVSESARVGMEMAEQADGVTKAFEAMDKPDLLDNLRKATKGTVNDVQLMTAAVQAKDFRIPLEDLGKYLQFAQLKAQQTGQSVDYMTNSIVTGLGRKSPLILDNLGISAAEISEKTKETGDFMKAVASIVDNQLAEAGDTYISAADKAAQKTTEWENAQRRLGEQLLPLKESYDDFFGEAKVGFINLITWLVENRKTVISLVAAYALFKTAQLAIIESQKIHLLLTKGIVAIQKAWNVVVATGNSLLTLAQAGYYLLTGRITMAKNAMATLNKTFKANVFGIVITAVTLLAMKLWELKKATDANALAEKAISQIRSDAQKQVVEEKLKLENLIAVAKDETASLKDRYTAVNELNRIIPGYNASIDETTGKYKASDKALTDYINSLVRLYEIQGAKDKLVEIGKQRSDLMLKKYEQEKIIEKDALDAKTEVHVSGREGKAMDTGSAALRGKHKSDLAKTKDALSDLDKQKKLIQGAYGNDIEKQAVKEVDPVVPDSNIRGTGNGGKGGGHTTTTKNTAPNPDDTASKKFAADRQAELDAENLAYQQDVNNWNMALAKKETSQEKYDLAMSALNTQHTANLLAIETSYAERSQNIDIKDAEKKKSLQDTQLKNQQAAEQKHLEQQIAAENAYQEALAKVMEQGGGQQALTLEDEYNQQMEILKGYYDAALALAKQNGDDITQLQAAYAEAQAKILSDYDEKRAAKLAEEADKEKQARQQLGFDRQSEYDQQLEQLQTALDNQYITQEEYEKKVQQLKRDSYMKQAQYYTELFSNTVSALQNAEMSNIDAKYDAEIKAAEGNTELQEKLEKKKANEKLKIQKKYADVNFAMQAAQIIANTATSIMKAYADMGPIAGTIAAALMSVTGTAQLVIANAERQKVKRMTLSGASSSSSSSGTRVASGRESGGRIDVEREQDGKHFNAEYDPKKRGYVNHPTVIVGEGPAGRSKEWVASNAALQNPTVAPLINILDAAQRAGNIRTFDLGKYLMAMQGRQLGGSIQSDAASGQPYQALHKSDASPMQLRYESDAATKALMTEMASLLRDLKNNGIPATVALTELDAKQKLREQSRGFAKK